MAPASPSSKGIPQLLARPCEAGARQGSASAGFEVGVVTINTNTGHKQPAGRW